MPGNQESNLVTDRKGEFLKMVYELTDTTKVAPLFEGWPETLIWSCLQKVTVHLAKKLGYEFDHEYTAYEVAGEESE